jgi:hypothetical protein
MIRATDFCGSITREKIVLTTYQRTRYTVHPSIKKVLHVSLNTFELKKIPL